MRARCVALIAQQLERDLAIEIGIVRGPHHAHAAGAELPHEPVLADPLAGIDVGGAQPGARRRGQIAHVTSSSS